jgi:plastocyanin
MRNLVIALLVAVPFVVAGCGGASGPGNLHGGGSAGAGNPPVAAATPSAAGATGGTPTITMGVAFFVGNTNLSIKAGQTVTFKDPASTGGTHDLVTGTQGQFTAAAGAPTEFGTRDGIDFSAGMSKTITFPTAGTFQITCTIHPPMQATIIVTP